MVFSAEDIFVVQCAMLLVFSYCMPRHWHRLVNPFTLHHALDIKCHKYKGIGSRISQMGVNHKGEGGNLLFWPYFPENCIKMKEIRLGVSLDAPMSYEYFSSRWLTFWS